MKNLNILLIVSALILSSIFVTCKKEQDATLSTEEYQFLIGISNPNKSSDLKNASGLGDVVKVVLTIQNDDGSATKYTSSEISIFQMNSSYFTQSLALKTGTYKLTQFVLIDSSGNTIYASPMTGSVQAQNITKSLPVSFAVSKNTTIPVNVEVLSTASHTPDDFGLAGFSIMEVKIFSFLIGVTDMESGNLLQAKLTVSNGSYSYIQNVDSIANNVAVVKDGLSNYTLTIQKSGYNSYVHTYSNDSLKLFTDTTGNLPLIIKLEKATEYLSNGGFETGDFSNWQVSAPKMNNGSITQSDKRSGSFSAIIHEEASLSRFLTVPRNGILSMSFKGNSGTFYIYMVDHSVSDNITLYFSTPPTNSWVDRKWNISYLEGHNVELVIEYLGPIAFIDDVSVKSGNVDSGVLSNSGFEEGNLNYWFVTNYNQLNESVTSAEKYSGNYSCGLFLPGTTSTLNRIAQRLIVPNNKILHMFIKTSSVFYTSHVRIYISDCNNRYISADVCNIESPVSDWTEINYDLSAFSGHYIELAIDLTGSSPDEKFFVDNITVE